MLTKQNEISNFFWGTRQIIISLHNNNVLIAPFDHVPVLLSFCVNVLYTLNYKSNAALFHGTALKILVGHYVLALIRCKKGDRTKVLASSLEKPW